MRLASITAATGSQIRGDSLILICATHGMNLPASLRPNGRAKRRCQLHASETVTDQTVPEGHQGLHGFLYGEAGAETHDDEQWDDKVKMRNIPDGNLRLTVQEYLSKRYGVRKAGVYAVISKDNEYQYVGFARNLHSALKVHAAAVNRRKCCYVETRPLASQAVANRASLQAATDEWISELASPLPGNAQEKHLWEAKVITEQETFEEKKLKLQRAMGEKLGEASVDPTMSQRRQDLIAAVSQDDWSSVIDAQTQETVVPQPQGRESDAGSQHAPGPSSPFSTAQAQEDIGRSQQSQSMTLESVDGALEEVRPFLIADGGNVEVASVEGGIVSLRLQGACGTCASSSSTMKLGIERSLRAAFGDALKEVRQVDAKDTGTTVHSVNSHLDMLRPAIKSYGGSIEVKEITDNICRIQYKGPPTIGTGITAAIKSQFPDITEVIML